MLQPLKLIFFSLLITSYSLSAQSQLKSDIKIYKNIGIIKNATGWAYNNQENSWTDHPNYIKKNILEDEMIICMGAGSISNWIREIGDELK